MQLQLTVHDENQASGQHLGWDSPAVEFSLRQRKNFLRLAVGGRPRFAHRKPRVFQTLTTQLHVYANVASAAGNAKSKAGMFID